MGKGPRPEKSQNQPGGKKIYPKNCQSRKTVFTLFSEERSVPNNGYMLCFSERLSPPKNGFLNCLSEKRSKPKNGILTFFIRTKKRNSERDFYFFIRTTRGVNERAFFGVKARANKAKGGRANTKDAVRKVGERAREKSGVKGWGGAGQTSSSGGVGRANSSARGSY